MNIEAYDADSLRKMVRLLEYENKILKDKLKKAGISYERTGGIFHNVQIVGMTGFVLNNVKRRYFVMNVKIPNG